MSVSGKFPRIANDRIEPAGNGRRDLATVERRGVPLDGGPALNQFGERGR